jgi:hypothetical protein
MPERHNELAGEAMTTTPQLDSEGYALYVKLWDLRAETPATVARAAVDALDEALMAISDVSADSNRWLPSPYGGAAIVDRVEDALAAARHIVERMTRLGFEISVAIAHGRFRRVHTVERWNLAAVAVNRAARIAHVPELRKHVAVDTEVASHALVPAMIIMACS